MRKLSMHRSGKGGGPKKVAPPSLPGHEVPQYYVPGYTLPVADTADFHSLDQSYDSTHSEGIYSTYAQEPIYRRPNNVGLRTFSSESAVQHAQHAQHVQQSIRPTEFKEPFPMNSTCSSSPSTPLSPAPRGSRSSMSSVDSGWASAPLALSSFGTRASNSSLNSDKTSNSSEEVVTRAQIKQRRLSSISSSGSIGLNSTFTYGTSNMVPAFPNSLAHSRQDPSRQSLRTFGSSESVGSQGSRRPYSRSSSTTSSCSTVSSSSSLLRSSETVSSLDYSAMIQQGVSSEEILNCWLSELRFSEYYSLFVSAGYDIQTITRMTPEDLTAIGIKKPNHRKKLKQSAEELGVGDGLPEFIPSSVHQFLNLLRLEEYTSVLGDQGYKVLDQLLNISIEDLEDIGFFRLGHQKRLLLGIKKVKELKKSGKGVTNFNIGGQGGQGQNQGHLHYYPEQVEYHSLPPLPQSNRFSSFHQPSTPLVHITEGEMYTPSDGFQYRREMEYRRKLEGGLEVQQSMPNPMPPIEPVYNHQQQRFERSQSEDPRPSVWQRFRSFDDSDLRRTGAERPFQTGTLPRPRATVKPLPVPPVQPEFPGSSPDKAGENSGKHLAVVRKPDFSSTEEGLSCDSDLLLPFANERAGTIKYKTNPGTAFNQFKNETHDDDDDDENEDNAEEVEQHVHVADIHLPPALNTIHHDEPLFHHNATLIHHNRPSIHPNGPSIHPNGPSIHHNGPESLSLGENLVSGCSDLQSQHVGVEDEPSTAEQTGRRGLNLLRTPTRNPNRSAGDVLQDIGTMLADLTDELDTMLKLDKS